MARSSSFISAALLLVVLSVSAAADDASPGVTAKEIKVGATFPFSGPASQLGNTGKSLSAYISMINDRGGINGRTVKLITLDDGFSPPKAVEQVRGLVKSEEVASACQAVDAASRISRSRFVCTNCGSIFDADVNAAKNTLAIASAQPEDFRGWPVNRAGLPAGSRKKTLVRAGARPFRAESSHQSSHD